MYIDNKILENQSSVREKKKKSFLESRLKIVDFNCCGCCALSSEHHAEGKVS
jgi:hypothetical protein